MTAPILRAAFESTCPLCGAHWITIMLYIPPFIDEKPKCPCCNGVEITDKEGE